MKNHIALLVATVLLISIPWQALANAPKITGYQTGHTTVSSSYQYRTVVLNESLRAAEKPESKVLHFGYKVDLDYIFKFEMSYLMGEPVVVAWVAYKPTGISPFDSEVFGSPLYTDVFLDQKIYEKIRVTEFKMKVGFFLNNRWAYRVFDTGTSSKPYMNYSTSKLMANEKLFNQYRSYNVSGSPDWNNLFENINDVLQAKQYFINFVSTKLGYGPSSSDFEIVKINIDTDGFNKAIYNYLQKLEQSIIKKNNDATTKPKPPADEFWDLPQENTDGSGSTSADDMWSLDSGSQSGKNSHAAETDQDFWDGTGDTSLDVFMQAREEERQRKVRAQKAEEDRQRRARQRRIREQEEEEDEEPRGCMDTGFLGWTPDEWCPPPP